MVNIVFLLLIVAIVLVGINLISEWLDREEK